MDNLLRKVHDDGVVQGSIGLMVSGMIEEVWVFLNGGQKLGLETSGG